MDRLPGGPAVLPLLVGLFLLIPVVPSGTASHPPPPADQLASSTPTPLRAAPPTHPIGTSSNSSVQGPVGGRFYNVTTFLPSLSSGQFGVYSDAQVAVDPTASTVFAVSQSHVLTSFGESNGTLLAYRAFPLIDTITSLAFDPVHDRLWLGLDRPGGGNLLAVDPSTLTDVANISSFPGLPGFEPYRVVFDAVSGNVFVDNTTMGYLIVNTSTDTAGGAHPCPVAPGTCPSGSMLPVGNNTGELVLETDRTNAVFARYAATGALVYQAAATTGSTTALDGLAADVAIDRCFGANATGAAAAITVFNCALGTTYATWTFNGTIDCLTFDVAHGWLVVASSGTSGSNISTYVPSGPQLGGLTLVTSFAVPAAPSGLAYDPLHATYVTAGTTNASTFAFTLGPFSVAHLYPEFPAYRTAVTVDPTDGLFLVADQAPYQLSAYREGSGALLWQDPGSVLGGFEVTSLAFDAEHDHVDAAVAGEPFVVVLDPKDGAALGAISLSTGTQPRWLAVDPTRSILYAGFTGTGGPGVWVVNSSSDALLVDLALPGYFIGAIAADPTDGTVDVAAYGVPHANLTEISGRTYQTLARPLLPESAPPTSLVVGGDGTAYVSYLGGANVSAVPALGSGPVRTFELPGGEYTNALAVDPALGLLYVSASIEPAAIDPVYVFNASAGSLLGGLPLDGWSDAVALDPSTHTLVLPLEYDGRIATVTEIPRPGAPAITAVLPGNDSLEVAWQPPAGLVGYSTLGYNLSVGTSAVGPWGALGVTTSLNTTIENLTDGRRYFIAVAAITAGGIGPGAVGNGTPVGVPYPPTSVHVTSNGSGSLDVSWSAPLVDDGAPVTRFTVVYQGGNSPASALGVGAVPRAVLHGLTPSTVYVVRVLAWNAAGSSGPSRNVSGTTLPSAPAGLLGGLVLWVVLAVAVVVVGLGAVVWIARRRARAGPPLGPPR